MIRREGDTHGGEGQAVSQNPGRPRSRGWKRALLAALFILALVLLAADLATPKHPHLFLERIPLIPALIGLAGSLVLALLARGLRRAIRREEDFYAD